MNEFLTIMQNWGGMILLLVLAVIGIVCSLAGSSSAAERRLSGKDDEHYVLRLPIGRVVYPLSLLAAGVVLEFLCRPLQKVLFPYTYMEWTVPVMQLAVAVIFGMLFWTQLAKVLRKRVFVNGDSLIVTPAIGHSIETNYKQIRTVANKIAGRDGGVIGKKIRTKEGNRFEVINTMPGYDLFVSQLEEKVELPNLTKKLFKKHDKKEGTVPVLEEAVVNEPLPQASIPAVEIEPQTQIAAGTGEKEPFVQAGIEAVETAVAGYAADPVDAKPAEVWPAAETEMSENEPEAEVSEAEPKEETSGTEPEAELPADGETAETEGSADLPEEAEEAALPEETEEAGMTETPEEPEMPETPEDPETAELPETDSAQEAVGEYEEE